MSTNTKTLEKLNENQEFTVFSKEKHSKNTPAQHQTTIRIRYVPQIPKTEVRVNIRLWPEAWFQMNVDIVT